MFGTYVPRLHHAIIAAFLSIALLALSGKAQGRLLLALNVGSLMFGFLFLLILLLLWKESNIRRIDSMSNFARWIVELDDEGRAMLAWQFPYLRYRMHHGEVREYFEDTSVPMYLFKEFLVTSDRKFISPRRDWCTAEKPEWAWLEIKEYLQNEKLIIPDSAAGSHSWMWKGNAYNHLTAYWGASLHLKDMTDEIVMHQPGYIAPADEGASD